MSDFSLSLHGSVKTGGPTENVDNRLENWRRSIRRVGGFWNGTADYSAYSVADLKDMYLNGIMRRLVENTGDYVTWEGFVGELELTLDGVTYTRSMLNMMNACKATYTRIGANLFTNGDVESGAWAAEGSPTTCERTTTWFTHGDYGMHCVTQAAPNDEGMEIENSITIEAEVAYQCTVAVNNVKGVWVLKIKDQSTDATIGKVKLADTGEAVMTAHITEDNTSTSVRVILIEKTAGDTGEIYADNARLTISPMKAETTWYTDTTSIADFGRIEEILLEGQMTNAAAIAKCQKELARGSWPRSLPPAQMESEVVQDARGRRDGLRIMFLGYVFTLNWRYVKTTTGEAQADTHIAALVGESDYVSAGAVAENTMTYLVSPNYPTRLWDVVEDIVLAGDSSNNRWEGGVYAGRRFDYQQLPATLKYHYAGGRLLGLNNAPVVPPLARPGLARIDDMPVGPGEISGDAADDPRNVYLDEVEFIAPDRLAFKRETRLRR